MLPRLHRLCRRADFVAVYRDGKAWANPLAVLHVRAAAGGQRIGFSVSKKVGSAVERNLMRRRLREIVRELLPGWKMGFDAVIVLRSGATETPFSDLRAVVESLSRQAALPLEPNAVVKSVYSLPAGGRLARRSVKTGADRTVDSKGKH